MKIGHKIKVQGVFAEFLGDAGVESARVKYEESGLVRTVPRSSVKARSGRTAEPKPAKKKKRRKRKPVSGREVGMAYTMAEFNRWHKVKKHRFHDPDAPPHEDNKVCLSPDHEAAYLAIRAAKQAAGESTWGHDQQSRRLDQRTGGYRQGRTGFMGVGRG